jgi:hypothetical protein
MIAPIIQGLERGPTIAGIETTKPPWPIYFIVSVENILGPETMLTVPLVVFLMLLVFPYLVEKMSVSKEEKSTVRSGGVLSGSLCTNRSFLLAAASRIVEHIV